jgi:competence protein ComEC
LGCAAAIVIDREKLKQTGALTLAFAKDGGVQMRAARAADEDRPWSPAPKRGWGRAVPLAAAAKDGQNQDTSEEPEPGESADASPLE